MLAQKVRVTKQFGGVKYYLEDREIRPREAYRRISINPEAEALYRSVTFKKTAASVMAFSGGVFIGFNIGRALSPPAVRKRLNGTYMAAGIGLIALSFPLHSAYRRKAEKAVDIYNSGLPYSFNSKRPITLDICVNDQGLGLAMNF